MNGEVREVKLASRYVLASETCKWAAHLPVGRIRELSSFLCRMKKVMLLVGEQLQIFWVHDGLFCPNVGDVELVVGCRRERGKRKRMKGPR